jgi:hypothetical protein
MKIIKYNTSSDITIEFQDEHKVQIDTTYCNFTKSINNPYDIRVCGKGYIGEGKFSYQENHVINKIYDVWKILLSRCYDELQRELNIAYKDCDVCEEWRNLQNFGRWYENNYYDVGDGKRMHIDKDILVKGNKLYSPETCLIVPQRINMIFMSKGRKDDLPTGVRQNPSGTYASHYNGIRYGTYKTLEEAVAEHDKQKRIHIRQVVEEYGDKLPPKVIEALLAW